MSDRDDEYRQEAADALALADKSKNERGKAAWLRIAQSWISLIQKPIRGEQRDVGDKSPS